MSTSSLNAVKNKVPVPTLGEYLWASFLKTSKGMFFGFLSILKFIIAPIWNSKNLMKKLTHFFMFAFLGLIVLWILFWMGQRPVFTIEHIQLQSDNEQSLQHINQALVRSQVVSQLRGNFFSMRLDHVRKAFEELPWVRSASVRRVWPNGISITIEEQQPLGIWSTSDGPRLINIYGELFTVNLAEVNLEKVFIDFSGPTQSNVEAIELYQQLNQWFQPLNARVVSLSLSSRYSWTTRLDNGMTFELGRDLDQKDRSQMKSRLDRFFKVWPEVKENFPQHIDYIDLRYVSGFAVRTTPKLEVYQPKYVQNLHLLGEVSEVQTQASKGAGQTQYPHNSRLKNTPDVKKSTLADRRKME